MIPIQLVMEEVEEKESEEEAKDEGKEAPLCFSFLFTGGPHLLISASGGFKIISFDPNSISHFFTSHKFAN